MHAAAQFTLSTVNVSAENVDGPIPAARVNWSTTVPSECVTSVRVDFRTSSRGPVVANYTTTNTSSTAVIQTGLQCATNYYITVVVTGGSSGGVRVSVTSNQVHVFVGGKAIVCMEELHLGYIMQVVHTYLGRQNRREFCTHVLAPQTSHSSNAPIQVTFYFMIVRVECLY